MESGLPPNRTKRPRNGGTRASKRVDEIRVVIADGNPIFREGIRGLLATAPNMRLVGEAAEASVASELVRATDPDVALIDTRLPDEGGLALTRSIKQEQPHVAIILLAPTDDEAELFGAIKAGAAAYFRNDVEPAVLIDAIRRSRAGEYLINESVLTRPLVASRVLSQFRDLSSVGQDVERLFAPLSPREIEVLEYISRGNSNKEIARALTISDQTVKNHITSILKKLFVNDRTQAVVYALRRGWIQLNKEE